MYLGTDYPKNIEIWHSILHFHCGNVLKLDIFAKQTWTRAKFKVPQEKNIEI